MNNKKIEVLAPVGNLEMYEAAKKGGCDAIYLSTKSFGARAFANNFDIREIKEITKDAHLNNIKVYVTINTLIKDDEIKKAVNTVEEIRLAGVDGLLIQDLGLFSLIRDISDIELHVSTQLSIYNLEGSRFLIDEGFNRIVIARETPIEEIKRITDDKIELEAFIHGSLCVSVSGQCLMSSFIGGRSGNRGACAQPCRKEYTLLSNKKEFKGTFLSASDLSTIHRMDDLLDANISSLKIEGRMKKPYYVYTAIKEYKKAIAKKEYDDNKLKLASNRSFTEGFIFDDFGDKYLNDVENRGYVIGICKNNKKYKYIDVLEDIDIGDTLVIETQKGKLNLTTTEKYIKGDKIPLNKFKDAKLESSVIKIYSKTLEIDLDKADSKKHPLDMKFSINGKEAKLILSVYDKKVELIKEADLAKKAPLTSEDIKKSLSKLGETPFYLENLEIDNDNKSFMAKSQLNALRREAIDKLLESFICKDDEKIVIEKLEDVEKKKRKLSLELFSLDEEIKNIGLVGRVYIHKLSDAKKIFGKVDEIFYIPPKYLFTKDYEKLRDLINENIEYIDGFSCNNVGDIPFFKSFNKKLHLEASNNVINSNAYRYFKNLGIDDISLSQELTIDEIEKVKGNFESIIYGRIAVMTMKHCPFSSIKKCGRKGCESCPYYMGQLISDMNDRYLYIRNINTPNRYTDIFQKPIESLSITLPDNIDMLRIVKTDEENISDVIFEYYNKYILDKKVKSKKEEFLGHYNLGLSI